jgi:hypothetical protein
MSKIISTFDEIKEDTYFKDSLNSDYYANSKNLTMDEKGRLNGLSKNFKVIKNSMDDWALSQIFQKNKMPAAYFKNLLDNGQIDMVRNHLNHHMENRMDKYLIRMKKNEKKNNKEVRAVLSEEYSTFDNRDLIEVIEEPIRNLNYEIDSYTNEEGIFMTRLVMDNMSENISTKKLDDVLKVGLLIMNSEIGRSGIRIFPMAYRVVCSNGLVAWENMGDNNRFYKKHRWIDKEDTRKWAEVAISEAVKEAEFSINKMKEAKFMELESPQEYIDKRLPRLNKSIKEKIKETWEAEWSMTKESNSMYSVINSMTSVARDYNPEQRLEIEKEAGKLIAA